MKRLMMLLIAGMIGITSIAAETPEMPITSPNTITNQQQVIVINIIDDTDGNKNITVDIDCHKRGDNTNPTIDNYTIGVNVKVSISF